MFALCLPAEALAQAGLPAENVYCRRALRFMLFLVLNSAIRILQLEWADFLWITPDS